MESCETFSFLTDVHGNLKNIDTFLHTSQERSVDHVIFGGDIAPKKMAIKFSGDGNNAMAVTPTQKMGDVPNFAECRGNAADLYEKGYMLFDTPFTLEEMQMLAQVLQKLEKPSYSVISNLDPNEIRFLERFGEQFIIKPLKSSPTGRKLFNRFCEGYNRLNWRNPIRSYKDFSRRLLVSNGAQTYGLGAIPSESIFRFILSVAPWEKWFNTYDELHKHALPKQRQFLHDFLERIKVFRETFRGSVSIILGNDDRAELAKDLDQADREGLITHATNRVVELNPRVQMLGYSCVPPVPMSGIYNKWFREEGEIRKEIDSLIGSIRPDIQYVIANIHCPPFGTNLDVAIDRERHENHYGSREIKTCLETTRREITVALFGHIHSAPEISGTVQDWIWDTCLYNPGASEYNPRFLFGNLEETGEYSLVNS